MHDVHRDSILYKEKAKKIKKRDHGHDHEDLRSSGEHLHEHDREDSRDTHSHEHHSHEHDDHQHEHHPDHETPHGHHHEHDDSAYEEHGDDLHLHGHDHEPAEDRAFTHLHEHGHNFFHNHHHSHHPEHTSTIHKILNDPARDWFAVALMAALILTGYFKVLPGYLSSGALVCAALIGIFPVLKNALFESIAQRRFSPGLFVGMLLLAGLAAGNFLAIALFSLFLLVGSFMRLNFSWRND